MRGRSAGCCPHDVLHTQILQKVIGQPIRVVRATWDASYSLGSLSHAIGAASTALNCSHATDTVRNGPKPPPPGRRRSRRRMTSGRCSSAAGPPRSRRRNRRRVHLVFEGTIQQLQGELALTYKVTKELSQRPPTLVKRRKQLAMDDDAEELLVVAATCSLGDDKMKVLTDEPMCACVDVFDDDVRVHFVSPTNPELGGVVLIATRDQEGVISLRGGDEYWWDGYPPIIHAREKSAAPAPRPAFAGSFFEKDVGRAGPAGGRARMDLIRFFTKNPLACVKFRGSQGPWRDQ